MHCAKHSIALITGLLIAISVNAEVMLVGIDEKISFENGKTLNPPPGSDRVLVVDIANPETPKILASLDLINSVSGPPTNLIVTPDRRLGLVANPLDPVKNENGWGSKPGSSLHLIGLEGTPRHLTTITAGNQPSGLDLTPDGRLLLIGNRAEATVTVVRIEGLSARVIDTVKVPNPVDAVSVAPDGRRALFTMRSANSIGVLHIDGERVTCDPSETIPVGIEPYNVMVSPRGDIALVCNAGVTGGNDGNIDPVTVIDIASPHPHVIDWVSVGDGPEGLMFSPDGLLAVAVLINGSQNATANPNTAWAANEKGAVALLSIQGKTVRKVQHVEVGVMPEGAVFSKDGRYLFVGNYLSDDITILRVDDGRLMKTGTFPLPGQPASMRGAE